MDINKPIENVQLLEKLETLKLNNDSQSEREFFRELIVSKLLSPVTEDSLEGIGEGETTLREEGNIKFIHFSDNEGNDYMPAFTDWNELKKWNDSVNVKALILSFDDYKTLCSNENTILRGFVLNPFGDNIVFDKSLIQEVESSVNDIDQVRTVMLGVPEKYPDEMINALIDFLPSLPTVKSAYLFWMVQGDDDKSYLLVIDATEDCNYVFDKIADIAVKYLAPDEKIDFTLASETFGRKAIEGKDPFYRS